MHRTRAGSDSGGSLVVSPCRGKPSRLQDLQIYTSTSFTDTFVQTLTPHSNSAGDNSGDNNVVGSKDSAGSGNTVTFPSILKDRDLAGSLSGLTNTIGSITNPSAGSGNRFLGNGNANGQNSGNG